MALSIGVDVGGTKIAAGVVDEDGAVLATLHRRSPATARNAIFTTIADVVNELAVHYDAPTIGVGAAGGGSSGVPGAVPISPGREPPIPGGLSGGKETLRPSHVSAVPLVPAGPVGSTGPD